MIHHKYKQILQLRECRYPFIYLGGERHCESKVSCQRAQCNVPSKSPDRCKWKQKISVTLTEATSAAFVKSLCIENKKPSSTAL